MAWKKEESNVVVEYKEERCWESGYTASQERWIKDFKPYYDLVDVYDIDDKRVLYRFKLDSIAVSRVDPLSPKFWNIIITQ
jgi:hypothetical protein